MGICHLQSCRDVIFVGGTEIHGRPALPAPAIANRLKDCRGQLAFENLFVRGQLEVGALSIGRKRGIDASHLECRAIKMRRGDRPG